MTYDSFGNPTSTFAPVAPVPSGTNTVSHGDTGGTRALVVVLLLHRHMPAVDVIAGLGAALAVEAAAADVVAVEARKANDIRRASEGATEPAPAEPRRVDAPVGRVVSLTERRLAEPTAVLAGLPGDSRPPPSVTRYDELLARRRPPPTPPADPAADAAGDPTTR